MPRDRALRRKQGQAGFSLFEMVVVICSIVILYMTAEQRLNDLPAAAERANFLGVLQQIETGVHLSMIKRLASGDSQGLRALEGMNPMDLLLKTPSNYLGALPVVDDSVRRRGAWYFETGSGDLVYVVGGESIQDVFITVAGQQVNMGQIRFRIMNQYSVPGNPSGPLITASADQARGLRWEGALLQPVRPFDWQARDVVAAAQSLAQ